MFERRSKVAIAFSGGVDSTLLAALAVRELGPGNVLLLHAEIPMGIPLESDFAKEFASRLGCRLHILKINVLEDSSVRENGPLRCYFCKKKLFSDMIGFARAEGFPVLADGTNTDDSSDWRPGARAADELGVIHPFLEAGYGKEKIRAESGKLGIENASWPASACMASRIPTGTPLEPDVMRKCLELETLLRSEGRPGTRVRAVGPERAEIEFPAPGPDAAESLRLLRLCSDRGLFARGVSVNPLGYRRGSMNRKG